MSGRSGRTLLVLTRKPPTCGNSTTLPNSDDWQNGVVESWVGSCRGELLDHVILLNKGRLKRKLTEYVRYYHEDRTHLGPEEETRPVNKRRHQGRVFTLSLERGLAAFITGTILQPEYGAIQGKNFQRSRLTPWGRKHGL